MSENKTPFKFVRYNTGDQFLTLCHLDAPGREETLEICLRKTHEGCNPSSCTSLTGIVDRVMARQYILSIFWGNKCDGDHLLKFVTQVDCMTSGFCMRPHRGACHRAGCGFEQDPIDSIAYENDRIRVLYTTGCVEYYDYSIAEKPEPQIEQEMGATFIPTRPPRLTAAISEGNVFGTICKVCGYRIQGPSDEYDVQLHRNVCYEVHHYALRHGI